MSAKDVVVRMRLEKAGMVKGLTDIKSGFDMVYGAASTAARAFDDIMTSGMKYGNMLRANSIDIGNARSATKGLVSDMALLKAANTAAEFRMGLTSKQFAVFARAAVVQSQKLGIEAGKALDDLLTGTARGSRRILDNLGLIVKEGAGVVEVVEEINKKVGDQQVMVENAGAEWAKLKVEAENAWNSMSKSFTESGFIGDALSFLADRIRDLGEAMQYIKSVGDALDAKDFGDRRYMERRKALDLSPAGRAQLEAALAKSREDDLRNRTASHPAMEIGASIKPGNGPRRMGRSNSVGTYGLGNYEKAMDQVRAMEHAIEVQDKLRELRIQESKDQQDASAGQWFGMDMAREIETRNLKIDLLKQESDHIRDLTSQYRKHGETVLDNADASTKFIVRQQAATQILRESREQLQELTYGGLQNFTTGLLTAADAAVNSGQSFGQAMMAMLKGTLMTIAREAAVRALWHAAAAMGMQAATMGVPNPGSMSHWAASAMFGAIAAGAGAGGIAIGKVAGSKKAGEKKASSAAGRDRTRRPSFGARTSKSDKPIPVHVNVYLGGKNNPSAVLLAKEAAAAAVRGRIAV